MFYMSFRLLVDGAYEYDESVVLGKGNFGKVFPGRCSKDNKLVAIKRIAFTEVIDSSKAHNELELMKAVKEKHVVGYLACDITNYDLYIIMEKCEGNLQDLQKNKFGIFICDSNVQVAVSQITTGYEVDPIS